jgi:hypothetical protein
MKLAEDFERPLTASAVASEACAEFYVFSG